MEWINFKERKPIGDILAIVCNKNGYMYYAKAIYHEHSDTWTLDDPNYSGTLTLEVTHYIEVPRPPKEV